ncbi:bifunctional lysylphosphatidylglycerol flippase/synthetase MprF [Macrococcus armenti]|uniref:bifunctional lysylphosphatidylglycerol flippase/synthetase MprF n=1 Tax=Macrococcus armenti TaxID=2875764 RepID=UPI001CCE4D18|nr:bifunctional lysylphosphatidylglycerol flippase/synthetase MprF [Macrococcus armenti]UBH12113.1 bifunctional lysylphosphatidylglycerol flippase/synthetase MprF [Macrococcus armenti]
MNNVLKKYSNLLKFLFMAILLSFVIYRLVGELASIDFNATLAAFKRLGTFELALIILSGLFAVSVLSLYDFVLVKRLNMNISRLKLFNISFISNALNAVLGFGGMIGAGLRLIIYRNHTDDEKSLIKVISLMLLSMISGMSILSFGIILNIFPNTHAFDHFKWYNIGLVLITLYLPLFIAYTVIKPVNHDRLLGIVFTLVSSAEWLAASGVFYLIFKFIHIDVQYSVIVSIFVVAALAGLLSLVPGGFGAFDLMIILGFKSIGIVEEKVLLALLIYRVAYYFVPFLVALVLSTFEFKGVARKQFEERFEDNRYFAPAIETSSLFLSILKDSIVYIPAIALGCLSFITGFIFLMLNGILINDAIFDVQHNLYTFLAALYSAACLLLMINAKGVMHDTRRAHIISIVSSSVLLIILALTYGNWLVYIWLSVLIALLIIGNLNIKMIKRPITLLRGVMTLIFAVSVLSLNSWILKMQLSDLLTQENIDFDGNLMRNFFIFLIIAAIILTGVITYFFNKKYLTCLEMHLTEEERTRIIETYGGNFVSHLNYTGDKSFFTNDEKDAFIMFNTHYDTIFVLGDPVGNRDAFRDLLFNFYEQANYFGYEIIFYQVKPDYLPLYHDFGNIFFKLGEEAVIPLSDFSISGKKKRAFRATVNKFETNGYYFEVVNPPFDAAFIDELKMISDEWLGSRNEMHFSVGNFNTTYLNKAPVGIIRNENEIIGFVSFMPTHYNNSVSVDLIRWKHNDLQMMDGLYLNTMLFAKEQYDYFNMGMAPLSNVGSHKYAFYRERFAGKIFETISHLYSFKGLRNYKEKYNPEWQPRYLVYNKGNSLLTSLLRVSYIINKKTRN